MASSLTGLNSVPLLTLKLTIDFICLVYSKHVKQEVSYTVILPLAKLVGLMVGIMAGKQASAVPIQSSAKFILNVYCQSVNSIEKSKRKNKEAGNGPL